MKHLQRRQIWIGTAGGAVGLIVAAAVYSLGPAGTPPPIANLSPPQAWEAAQPHLKNADDDMQRAVDRRLRQVQDFFAFPARSGRLAMFAEDALGLGAKWKLVTEGRTPFDDYITGRFQSLVLAEDDCREFLAQLVADYQRELDAADNKALVAIQADIEGSPGSLAAALPTTQQIHESFAEAIRAAQVQSSGDLTASLGRQLVSFVAMEVVTQVATEALTSAGILGAGTMSSVASFGIGILAGIAVDYVINEITAPKEKLVAELHGKLTDLGDSTVALLRPHLKDLAHRRSALRRNLIAQAIGVSP